MEDNLSDLQPRNHLYVSSGVASLPVSFVLDTTLPPDGFHELAAVAYEGTSVRTQTRVSRVVQIRNTDLSATLTSSFAGTNVTIETPLQFSVTADSTNIASIELFSTGGSIGVVSDQPTAVFAVPSNMLGLGLHPFYALATDTLGNRYRTETDWIRLIPSITLSIAGSPLTLTWPAFPGQQYDILATADLTFPFQIVGSIVASNSIAEWPISEPGGTAWFYRVRLTP